MLGASARPLPGAQLLLLPWPDPASTSSWTRLGEFFPGYLSLHLQQSLLLGAAVAEGHCKLETLKISSDPSQADHRLGVKGSTCWWEGVVSWEFSAQFGGEGVGQEAADMHLNLPTASPSVHLPF